MNRTAGAQTFIITGMSGTGKTALLEQLRADGYTCFEEPARKILENHVPEEGDGFASSFIDEMLRQSLADFRTAESASGTAFFDRGIPDTVAYAIRFGGDPEKCATAADDHRYQTRVFVAPPWPEIFAPDEYRRATYDEYLDFHKLLLETYRRFGYSLLELPKQAVGQRAEFVRASIGGGR